MKTYNLQLRTSEEINIQVQANSRQEAKEKIARIHRKELKNLIAEIPPISGGWSTQ